MTFTVSFNVDNRYSKVAGIQNEHLLELYACLEGDVCIEEEFKVLVTKDCSLETIVPNTA
jgi:hypothetical protein